MTRPCRPLVVVASLLLAAAGALAKPIWWEAENPQETNFPDRTWLSLSDSPEQAAALSGGAWLTNDGPRAGPEAFARWTVEVPKAGTYRLWARKFWKHGPFRWRFGRQEWRRCGRDVALADSVSLRTHVCVNWVFLGVVELSKGRHRFEIRLLAGPDEKLTAAFDCFHLASGPFLPRGKRKPGEPFEDAPSGWWAYEPDPDDGDGLDLRPLNETRAGESGPVRRDGNGFRLGNGEPVRFWGVNCGPELVRQDGDSVRYLARRLARRGVNAVRIHGAIFDRSARDPATVDAEYLDRIQRFVHAMAAEGIYSTLSFYFPLWFDVRPGDGLDGYESTSNKHPFGLLFFEPRLQELHRAWMKRLLMTPDPHAGVPLGKNPAVAMVEIVNEDSLLFWTFDPGTTIPLARAEVLENAFGAWLAKRHGSLDRAARHWGGGAAHPRDAFPEGRAGLHGIWHLTGPGHGEGPRRRRASDQLRFLCETQRGYYEETVRHIREDLGCTSLVVCGNWKTADPRVLGVLERWTYTAGDVVDRHGYFGGKHEGEGANYSVRVGHRFEDRAAVRDPAPLPLSVGQVEGFPQIVSEIGWPSPNRFRADYPVLSATYGALQGLDGLFLFACGGPGFDATMRKFPVDVPTVLGQSPACALIFRRGDVAEAKPVVTEALALEDLYDFRGSAHRAPPALDALRGGHGPRDEGDGAARVDPFAWCVGPVVAKIASRGKLRVESRLGKLIDRKANTVTTRDGSLTWAFGAGLVRVDTDRAQGVTGFLKAAGAVALRDVTVESGNEYGSVLVVSLDGAPIRRSRRLLVQAVTEDRPHGFTARGGRITALGSGPMLMREVEATVTIEGGKRFGKVRALDPGFREQGRLRPKAVGRDLRVVLPRDATFVLLEDD